MKKLLFLTMLLLGASFAQASNTQDAYQISWKARPLNFPRGGWDGHIDFPEVYCAKAPVPELAIRYTKEIFNGHSISLASIKYKKHILLTVSASGIPRGRTPEEEISNIYDQRRLYRQKIMEADSKAIIEVEKIQSNLGLTVAVRADNQDSETPETGPFPLVVRHTFDPVRPLVSISEYRLFARGPNKIEVAGIQFFPHRITESEEKEAKATLKAMVESLNNSLQECTNEMLIRKTR